MENLIITDRMQVLTTPFFQTNLKSVEPHDFLGSFYHCGKEYPSSFCRLCGYDDYKNSTFDFQFGLVNYFLLRSYLHGFGFAHSQSFEIDNLHIANYMSLPKVKSTEIDKQIFVDALKLVEKLENSDKAGAYIKLLYESKIIPSSTKERVTAFVDILGALNILHGKNDYAIIKGKEKYDKSYRDPIEHKNDHPFPLTHRKASDGVNKEEVKGIWGICLQILADTCSAQLLQKRRTRLWYSAPPPPQKIDAAQRIVSIFKLKSLRNQRVYTLPRFGILVKYVQIL